MPCGGIYPVAGSEFEDYYDKDNQSHSCFHCGKHDPKPSHFCIEWDCYIHNECIDEFLETPEGQVVLNHGHDVVKSKTTANPKCPNCKGYNTHKIYRAEVYEYGYFCRDCDKGFDL